MTRSMPIVSTTALATALLWSAPALAQDAADASAAPPAPAAETYSDAAITVTGSRIQRDGFRAPTPLTVLNAEDIESSAPANIADYAHPALFSTGMRFVLVNGVLALENGEPTGAAGGTPLPRTPAAGSCK